MNRKEGYYWVKLDDPISPDWHVALWHDNDGGFDGGDWCWRSHHFDGKGRDSMFSEINETRILDPDELLTQPLLYIYWCQKYKNFPAGTNVVTTPELEAEYKEYLRLFVSNP